MEWPEVAKWYGSRSALPSAINLYKWFRFSQILWKLCRSQSEIKQCYNDYIICRKIRLQIQGEAAKLEGAVPKGAIHIIRQLGILGLYRGASACLLRDIPFSAIYFPAYSHLKKDVFREGHNGKHLSFLETLAAAGIAYVPFLDVFSNDLSFVASGMPAAYLTTPAGPFRRHRIVQMC